jgi:hypothetical protein
MRLVYACQFWHKVLAQKPVAWEGVNRKFYHFFNNETLSTTKGSPSFSDRYLLLPLVGPSSIQVAFPRPTKQDIKSV